MTVIINRFMLCAILVMAGNDAYQHAANVPLPPYAGLILNWWYFGQAIFWTGLGIFLTGWGLWQLMASLLSFIPRRGR